MSAKGPLSSDWDLDFGDDNVVSIQRAAGRRASDTQRGIPRVVPTTEPPLPPAERPLTRTPPGQVSHSGQVRRLHTSSSSLSSARAPGNPWGTQEWSPSEPKASGYEARGGTQEWAPPEPRTGTQEWSPSEPRVSIARARAVDPQSETTLEVDAASLPRRAGRRTSHADLDLMSARHEDPYHQSALIVLAELHAERWQPWLAFAVSTLGAGALLAWFLI